MAPDDYYDEKTGVYLGRDNALTDDSRLIDKETFNSISKGSKPSSIAMAGRMSENFVDEQLQGNSRIITVDDKTIQGDLQSVADNSQSGVEHQVYIVLDLDNAQITSTMGAPGTNSNSTISYYNNPKTGLNSTDPAGRNILIGQAHGHPATTEPGKVTSKTMSGQDASTSRLMGMAIYGVDAMDPVPKGSSVGIHRVVPSGKITKNIGKTSSGFNIALDALKIWK